MDNRLVSAGCCGLLALGWGGLVISGHADAAPLVNFLQMAAYTALGLAAHGFATGAQNAKTSSGADAEFVSGGVRLSTIGREPKSDSSTAEPAEPG